MRHTGSGTRTRSGACPGASPHRWPRNDHAVITLRWAPYLSLHGELTAQGYKVLGSVRPRLFPELTEMNMRLSNTPS